MGVAAVAAGAMVGQQVLGYFQQSQQAEYEQDYQDAMNKQAYKSAREQYSQLSYQEVDALQDNLEEGIDTQVQTLQAKSKVNLMAAASGTGGLSVDDMLTDISRQKGDNMTQVARNRATSAYNIRQQAESIRYGAKIDTRKISKPSAINAALGVTASAAQGYMTAQSYSNTSAQAASASSIQGGT